MRKALILTIFASFSSESLAQNSFRHASTVALDDVQDNEMNFQGAINEALKHYGNAHRIKFDEAEGNEMVKIGPTVLINHPTTKMGMMDDFEDDVLMSSAEMAQWEHMNDYERSLSPWYGRIPEGDGGPAPSDTFRSQNQGVLGYGGTGVSVGGGSASQGGIGVSGSGQYSGPMGSTGVNYIVGATVSHSPGAPVSVAPHAGISISF